MLHRLTPLAVVIGVIMAACSSHTIPAAPSTESQRVASTSPAVRYKSLYSFKGGTDGAVPEGMVALNGALYGTTEVGGNDDATCGDVGCGTLFEMATPGSERVVYRFKGGDGGAIPGADLIALGGMLYGVTYYGGAQAGASNGNVFAASTSGTFRVLHTFRSASDGASPQGPLVAREGVLYGTTSFGGGSACHLGGTGCGIVFNVNASGKERVVYRFAGGADGSYPIAGLTAANGALYGTTYTGGGSGCTTSTTIGCGTVFEVKASGKETVVHRFQGGTDGAEPIGGLALLGGTLYGTTTYGGGSACTAGGAGCGTVFSVNASGQESVLYRFKGGTDGANPYASLVAVNGELYGTTNDGGGAGCEAGAQVGCGTVFAVSTSGKERVLYRFKGGLDGDAPDSSLVSLNGMLYSTATSGGAASAGTIFEVSP